MQKDAIPLSFFGRLSVLVAVLGLPLLITACDQQLEQEAHDQITPESFFSNEDEFLSAAAAAYAPLRSVATGSPFDIQEHSSDEVMVPTRGPNWGDNGVWRELTQHNWSASHPYFNGAWTTLQTGISRTNGVLTSLGRSQGVSEEQKTRFEAEMRFLRAFYYYWLMDLFGSVPIVVEEGSELDFPKQPVSAEDPPPQNTRTEVYDFILSELTGCTSDNFNEGCVTSPDGGSVLANLPTKSGVQDHGRARLGAGHALLARLLLNSEIYTGTPTPNGIEPGVALYEEASAAADQVLNSGQYSLTDQYKDNFAHDNFNSSEIIFAAAFKADLGNGNIHPREMTHPNLPTGVSTWNGFTTIAEFYNSFENVPNNQHRQNQLLAGRQYQEPNTDCWAGECFSDSTSTPIQVRGLDVQVNFTPEIPSIILEGDAARLENPGARPFKYEIGPGPQSEGGFGNDFPFLRLAEVFLIKAEAENELGNTQTAVNYLNDVRDRSDADEVEGVPTQSEMRKLLLQERGYEFLFEAVRRQDLIRYEFAHGGQPVGFEESPSPNAEVYAPTFTGPWRFKSSSDGCRALFPIPENQLNTNPNLEQNPGYPGCGSGVP